MSDQIQESTNHTRQIGEGVFAVTTTDHPPEEVVALFVRRAKPDPDHFTETWIYSDAYVAPELGAPVTYKLAYSTFMASIWDNSDQFVPHIRGVFPKFATGTIRIDTHTVDGQTIPAR